MRNDEMGPQIGAVYEPGGVGTINLLSEPRTGPSRSEGLLVALGMGGALCATLGVSYAIFASRVGVLFSLANILAGVLLGRVVRARIGAANRGLAPVIAAVYTYIAGAMVFLPAVLVTLNEWDNDVAAQRENLEWVRGAAVDRSAVDVFTVCGLVLRAPFLVANASSPMPLVFTAIGVFYAVKEATREDAR